MAQSNVYSLNVVGYVNTTLKPGYTLIANPLNTTNNTLLGLFGGVGGALPDGTQVYLWTGTTFNTGGRDDTLGDANGWTPDAFENNQLPPGVGAFIKNNTANPITVTFVGEVLQGGLTNHIGAGYQLIASMVPQAGQVDTVLGMPAVDGDQVYQWNNTTGAYTTFTHDSILNTPPPWGATVPNIGVGEGFFSNKGAAVDWVRNFTVQ
jgi:hypothetical protein